MAVIALKAMAHQQWPKGKKHRWKQTFYEPFDDIDRAALGLRFTFHLPVTAMFHRAIGNCSRWPWGWLRRAD